MVGGTRIRTVFARMALGLALTGPCAALAAGESRQTDMQPQGLDFVGLYALRQMDPSLTGAGARITVLARSRTYLDNQPQNDYQPNLDHHCFGAARVQMLDSGRGQSGICDHSTAVCSILAGEDREAAAPFLGRFHYQGVAPQADLDVVELWHFLTDRVFRQSQVKADVVTLSSGSDFEDWWTRGLESMAERQGLLVVGSIGNGTDALHPPLFPGAGSNVLGVGVVDPVRSSDLATSIAQFSLARPEHSSCGPTADSRCKPDLVAPGHCLVASATDPNGYELTDSGSSFATPIVAGIAALLKQKAKQDPGLAPANLPETSACLIKAVLMNSAVKLPYWHKGKVGLEDDRFVPLDHAQGAGLIDAVGAYDQLTAGRFQPGPVKASGWDVGRVAKTRAQVYQIDLPRPAGQMITATLVWNRHYQSTYPFDCLADLSANLRLQVWAADPANPRRDILIDSSDSPVDNVEHIHVKTNPRYRTYQIVVLWSEPDDGKAVQDEEPYGLAWRVAPPRQDHSILWDDLNGDGVVDDLDYARLVQNWGASLQSSNRYAVGDINSDGAIDGTDLEILTAHGARRAEWYTP
ncbi:MAG: S8 family serine peptidase [Phycisphaerae bacterium]|nr:S8 family serine peptidase [Phycisphaerae bacterium]